MKSTKHLLLDSRVVARAQNAELVLGRVTKDPGNPLFSEDRPWEVRIDNMYPNVILDPRDGLYKLWYTAFLIDPAMKVPPGRRRGKSYNEWQREFREVKGWERELGLCYAVSRDGLTWEKPPLGLVEFQGSKANNIVLRRAHGMGIFLDDREKDPAKRFKAFGRIHEGWAENQMVVSFSPDGLRWGEFVPCPGIGAPGDTHNNALWAPTLKRYVGITRLTRFQEGPIRAVRMVGRTQSRDFTNWTRAKLVFTGLEENLQIYSMPTFCYAGVYLAVPAIYNYRTDRTHTELAWSPDTKVWHRVCPGRPLIANGRRGSYDWGCVYASRPVILDDEIRIYYGGSDERHFDWRKSGLCLARLWPDGFAGYHPIRKDEPGVIVTNELRCCGSTLRVSADVGRGGSVRAGVVGDRLLAVNRCQPIMRSVTDGRIEWGSHVSLPRHPVRLRFELRNATLCAFGFGT